MSKINNHQDLKPLNNANKLKNWTTTLFALVFLAAPAIIGYVFLLPDWTGQEIFNYGYVWLIALAFLVYVVLINLLLVWLKVLSLDSWVFTLPLTLVFIMIFVTYPLTWWARALLVFLMIFVTIPINLLVEKFTTNH